MPLFECPAEHRQKLEEVKAALHISHRYLDSWVYLFLHNKKYDVAETIAKLHRRDAMEKSVYAHYEMTPYLKQSMRGGIVQYIGRDKAGRPVLFFNTARDFPTTEQRPARQANLDMFLGWSVRCDQINPTSTVTWLINQKDASMMRNTDLIFQKDMALRISKFFPGVVAKMYLCNMSTALTFVLKPLVKQLPSGISECIHMFSGGDLRKGKLLEFIDAEVLPVSMGGTNDCDNQDNYNRFGDLVEGYFDRCMHALRQGISIKEMEMMEAYGVDQHGQKVVKEVASPSPLTEEVVKPAQHPIHVNVVDGASVLVTSTSHKNFADVRQLADSFSSGTAAVFHPHPGRSSSAVDGTDSFTALAPSVLPTPNMQLVEDFSFGGESLPLLRISTRESDELLRDWTRIRCFAVELIPCLRGILSDLRDHSLSSSSLRSLMEQKMRIRRMAHHLLNLSPQTNHRMAFPVFRWLNECLGDERSIDCAALDRLVLDCSSPDDVLISLQGAAVSYIDDCTKLMEMNKVQERILRSVLARWTMDQTREGLLATLRSEAQVFWEELRGYFRRYIDAKVAISLAEFIRHYDLLLPEGRIDMQATWYRSLSTELVHFREGHRRNWLFHVFPPLRYDDHGTEEEVELPLLPDMLRAANRDGSFDAVAAFVLQAEYSISATRDQFAARTVMTAHTREMVERFIEESEGKISIPYAEQQNGILPASMVEAQKDLARQHLDACEDPMRELLSRLAMMYVLGHPISEGEDRATAVRSIDRRRRLWSELTDARQDSRRLAVSYSQSAYDMQGSFGEDAENVLFITNYPPDGYALGLQMLLLVAFLQHRGRSTGEEASCFGGEMAMDGGGTPLSTRGEEAMQQRDAIATFLTSLTAMEPAASHMAAIKRRFIP